MINNIITLERGGKGENGYIFVFFNAFSFLFFRGEGGGVIHTYVTTWMPRRSINRCVLIFL